MRFSRCFTFNKILSIQPPQAPTLLLQVVEENKKLSEKITCLAEELAKKTQEETAEMNELNNSQTEGIKSKAELYIENESFSENGGENENSATETNGKYDCSESDFDKTENDMVASADSLDGEAVVEEDEDDDEDDLTGEYTFIHTTNPITNVTYNFQRL